MSLFFLGLKKNLLKTHAALEKRANTKVERDFSSKVQMTKTAFDTRRINSEMQVNPRRNLQYYQRSEPFIDPAISTNIKQLFKIKTAVDQIKEQYIGDPDWLDSNSRILSNAIDNTLRVEQKDYDFFKPQFDYINELLYLRYRIAAEDLERMNENELKKVILNKDEKLLHKEIFANYKSVDKISKISDQSMPIVKQTIVSQEDSLMEKLFGGVKASSLNKNVKRSVNITISDSIEDEKANEKEE